MADLKDELSGKVAIVTGSARNIGRATALELVKAGAASIIGRTIHVTDTFRAPPKRKAWRQSDITLVH